MAILPPVSLSRDDAAGAIVAGARMAGADLSDTQRVSEPPEFLGVSQNFRYGC